MISVLENIDLLNEDAVGITLALLTGLAMGNVIGNVMTKSSLSKFVQHHIDNYEKTYLSVKIKPKDGIIYNNKTLQSFNSTFTPIFGVFVKFFYDYLINKDFILVNNKKTLDSLKLINSEHPLIKNLGKNKKIIMSNDDKIKEFVVSIKSLTKDFDKVWNNNRDDKSLHIFYIFMISVILSYKSIDEIELTFYKE